MSFFEVNFDGIVGPTHNYAGLSLGNIASASNAGAVSSPKKAALEGLAKMKFLMDLGVKQAFIPPLLRPSLRAFYERGIKGDAAECMRIAAPDSLLVAQSNSASSMWVANAATVSPSCDTRDGKTHFTPANLVSKYHRALEAQETAALLKQIFPGEHFMHHPPLDASSSDMADEGAANHMRLCTHHGAQGLEIFVYGRAPDAPFPERFCARQSRAASLQVAENHALQKQRLVFVQQNPEAIDAGVFHNDVIAMSNENMLILHEAAWHDQPRALAEIKEKMPEVIIIEIGYEQLLLSDAVESYFFNSQLVTLPSGTMAVIAPKECEAHPSARACFDRLLAADNPIEAVYYLDVRESMRNGGGPACLRLRVALHECEFENIPSGCILTQKIYESLCAWVNDFYPDQLAPEQLADPAAYERNRYMLTQLYRDCGLELPL